MNRVQYTTTTTGTGAVTLSVAAQSQAITAAINTNEVATGVIYTIVDADGTDWETGYGTISGGVLTRVAIFESTNADAAVSLSTGTHDVYINRTFYEGHMIVDGFKLASAGSISFSTASETLTFAAKAENSTSQTIDGSNDCPGRGAGTISDICTDPSAEIPYCRGYSLHMRAYTSSTQAGEYFGITIENEGFGIPLGAAWGPIANGYYISCSTPVIEAKNPFTGSPDLLDQTFNQYKVKNSSGVSITVFPELFITWYI